MKDNKPKIFKRLGILILMLVMVLAIIFIDRYTVQVNSETMKNKAYKNNLADSTTETSDSEDDENNETTGTLKGTVVDANSTIYRRNSYNVITRKDELTSNDVVTVQVLKGKEEDLGYNDLVNIVVEKKWNVPEPSCYRVKVGLIARVNGNDTPEVEEGLNESGDSETIRVTRTIVGNSTAFFEGLRKEEGGNEIEYIVEEIEIEKRSSTDSDDWQQVEPDTFKYAQVEATVMEN